MELVMKASLQWSKKILNNIPKNKNVYWWWLQGRIAKILDRRERNWKSRGHPVLWALERSARIFHESRFYIDMIKKYDLMTDQSFHVTCTFMVDLESLQKICEDVTRKRQWYFFLFFLPRNPEALFHFKKIFSHPPPDNLMLFPLPNLLWVSWMEMKVSFVF